MDNNPENVRTLCQFLDQTMSPEYSVRKTAEDFLYSNEGNAGYSRLLLGQLKTPDVLENVQLAAVICFKNFVKRNWKVDDVNGVDKICQEDREFIKAEVIGIMTSCKVKIQKQFSEAVAIIGKEDFPEKWQNLMPEMISKLESDNFSVVSGILLTANSLFRRYRFEFKSQELWTEIKHVLVTFAVPLTSFFVKVHDASLKCSTENAALAGDIYGCLYLISQIFYSLSYQDIPEEFEDRLEIWMTRFHQLLDTNVDSLQTSGDEEASVLEQLKSEICESVAMYATKYDEEFAPFLPTFVTSTWKLLVSTGLQPKYDSLVSHAMEFLTCVSEKAQFKELFEQENVLKSICEQVVITNIQFRNSDEELFELNPEEYVRRDMEGSDFDTRRRAACDLVKGLCKFFEAPVTTLFSQFVNIMIAEYISDPKNKWRSKDAAVFLVTSLAVKAKTEKMGTTQIRDLVNVSDFFVNIASKEFFDLNSINEFPVLRADAIKYIVTFRNHLEKDIIVKCLQALAAHLRAENAVVHTYACICLEKLLLLKSEDKRSTLVTVHEVQPLMESIVTGLCSILGASENEENEHAMKCLMRLCSFSQTMVLPSFNQIFPVVSKKLKDVIANPKKPLFIHYLFETIAVNIKIYCTAAPENKVETFESLLLPDFEQILTKDILEILPYMFQILTLMMEMNKGNAPEFYMSLFPFLLNAQLWERQGNVPAVVGLLRAYLRNCSQSVATAENVKSFLGIFQKLINSKTNDQHGFRLLNAMFELLPFVLLEAYVTNVLQMIFQRLSRAKTTKFVKCSLVFFGLFAAKVGAEHLVNFVESIQPGLFGMIVDSLILKESQKITGAVEKKIYSVGLIKILVDCPPFQSKYAEKWHQVLEVLIAMFELPTDQGEVEGSGDHFVDLGDNDGGYQNAYSQAGIIIMF